MNEFDVFTVLYPPNEKFKSMVNLSTRTKDKEMTEDEVSELKAAQEKMMEKAQSLFSKMYESMQGAGGAGPDMSQFTGAGAGASDDDGSSAGAADDIIDGDFREV